MRVAAIGQRGAATELADAATSVGEPGTFVEEEVIAGAGESGTVVSVGGADVGPGNAISLQAASDKRASTIRIRVIRGRL